MNQSKEKEESIATNKWITFERLSTARAYKLLRLRMITPAVPFAPVVGDGERKAVFEIAGLELYGHVTEAPDEKQAKVCVCVGIRGIKVTAEVESEVK